jgi:hypothetical protein
VDATPKRDREGAARRRRPQLLAKIPGQAGNRPDVAVAAASRP